MSEWKFPCLGISYSRGTIILFYDKTSGKVIDSDHGDVGEIRDNIVIDYFTPLDLFDYELVPKQQESTVTFDEHTLCDERIIRVFENEKFEGIITFDNELKQHIFRKDITEHIAAAIAQKLRELNNAKKG